jgi:hypothetical protein
MKRLLPITVLAGLLAGTAIAAVLLVSNGSDKTTATEPTVTEPRELNTAVVALKDFVDETEVGGTLGFGVSEPLPNLASGVVTWLPEPGAIVELGDVLFEINGRPVVLLSGQRPYYRALTSRSTDGADVLQLEEFLVAGGFGDEGNLTVDTDFTSKTADAIERWELSLGIEATGELAVGMVVIRDEGFRIDSINAAVGQQVNGGSVLTVSSTERFVTVLLDTGLTGLLSEGQVVDVELPDESVVPGTVTFVSGVAVTEGQGQNATSYLEVEIVLDGSGGTFDQSPVTIRVEEILEDNATVVPIASLLALAEGGYAVELMQDGQPRLVGVELGTFLDNEVAIIGSVEPGDEVVVP